MFKVTVIIPTKNPGRIFRDVMNGVQNQKTNFKYEVLLIDSGSTDGYIEQYAVDNGVRIISIEPQTFQHGRTRNFAVSNCESEYVVMLTHDATPFDDKWLSSLVAVMDSDSEIAGAFSRHVAYPDHNFFIRQEIKNHFIGLSKYPLLSLDDPKRYTVDDGYRQLLYFFSDNSAIIRKSIWEEIKYPEINFAEDQAWARLIIEAGYKKAYVDSSVVYHSHNFKLFERLQRSFDETRALTSLFGYKNLASSGVLPLWVALSKRDIKALYDSKNDIACLSQILYMPFNNFMRALGTVLGNKATRLPKRIVKFLSWDQKLFDGKR